MRAGPLQQCAQLHVGRRAAANWWQRLATNECARAHCSSARSCMSAAVRLRIGGSGWGTNECARARCSSARSCMSAAVRLRVGGSNWAQLSARGSTAAVHLRIPMRLQKLCYPYVCLRCVHRSLWIDWMNAALAASIFPYSALSFRKYRRCVDPSSSCSLSVSEPKSLSDWMWLGFLAAARRWRSTVETMAWRSALCVLQCSITCAVLSVVRGVHDFHWQ